MGNIFAASEVVEIGIQIEKNGRDFYETLTGSSKSDKARDIFRLLAGEEEAHIKVFRKMLDSVQKYEPHESYPGEYFEYMKSLAEGHVFTKEGKGAEIAGAVKTDGEAIDLGIGFEKDSIEFYEGMKKVVPEHDLAIVDGLISQEEEHLRKLSGLKKGL